MSEYLLEMKQIVKKFPGTLALNHVDFNLKSGEVMALIGENGAGKSTLMNVLMGVLKPEEGEVYLQGTKIEIKSPYEALQHGIGMVPQELNLVTELSIAENIYLGCHQKTNGIFDWKKTAQNAQIILKKLKVDIDPKEKVKNITAAFQELVSIARTLVFGSNIIILDEPTASLTIQEKDHLFEVVRMLKSEGKTIVIITHHLDEVKELSDRVTIMRDGTLVKVCQTDEVTTDEMIFYMANQKVEKNKIIKRNVSDEIVLEARGLTRKGEFEDVSFQVRKGEIFGVAGLVGAGRTELFSCIYGLTKSHSGSLYLNGKEVVMKSPVDAIANGIGLVPEERRKQGMFALLSIYENVMMPSYHTISSKGVINFDEAKKRTNRQIDAMRIKTPSCNTQIKNLSGGNQQKVILGRWMEKNVDILILDEPTRGIDVRAKGEIYRLIREMADNGVTVIVISSEMDELISVSDRIMVMHEGLVKGFMEPSEDMVGEEILKVALK